MDKTKKKRIQDEKEQSSNINQWLSNIKSELNTIDKIGN